MIDQVKLAAKNFLYPFVNTDYPPVQQIPSMSPNQAEIQIEKDQAQTCYSGTSAAVLPLVQKKEDWKQVYS